MRGQTSGKQGKFRIPALLTKTVLCSEYPRITVITICMTVKVWRFFQCEQLVMGLVE